MLTQTQLDQIAAGSCALGIEYGSTRIKAVLVDSQNKVLATGAFDWENSLQNGYWTYGQEELSSGLQAAYLDLKHKLKAETGITLSKIAALGISAMMHGYLAFNAENELLVPFRTWRNTTTTVAAKALSEAFAFHVPERWSISHLYQAILDKEEHVKDIAWFTTLSGYAHFMLSGKRVLSVGDASGMFPIDSTKMAYDEKMLAIFDELSAKEGFDKKVVELLPEVLLAGDEAGYLTAEGAALLDPEGDLLAGSLMCPPEGDAGTGMIATNSVAPRTGNVSAGTSVFSMVVLEKALKDSSREEIDLVTTPVGDPVAMVHCNNCTSDINAYVDLFIQFAEMMGETIDRGEAFTRFFNLAKTAEPDAGGLISLPFISGETVMGIQTGYPVALRMPGAKLSLANFSRQAIMAAFAALAFGNIALKDEGVKIDKLYAHGGIFKTPEVAQSILAAALDCAVTVMETAGEGGAWGQAVAANYALHKEAGQSLADYLNTEVFSDMAGTVLEPKAEDVAGYKVFLERFVKANEAEKVLEELLGGEA